MNRILPAVALALVSAATFAAVAPLVAGGRDLTRIPPDPVTREKELAQAPVSLAKAIEVAAKDGGAVASAAFNASGQIELSVFQGGAENAVVVDGKSGAVVSKTAMQRFAGEPVTGAPTTTEGGVICYDLKLGDGAEVAKASEATVHCTGWLIDGTKFWSSHDGPGQPFAISMTPTGAHPVIPGWREGVPGMKVGGKRKLVVPGNLGYGPGGRAPLIPPNAVLVFDIELFAVQ